MDLMFVARLGLALPLHASDQPFFGAYGTVTKASARNEKTEVSAKSESSEWQVDTGPQRSRVLVGAGFHQLAILENGLLVLALLLEATLLRTCNSKHHEFMMNKIVIYRTDRRCGDCMRIGFQKNR